MRDVFENNETNAFVVRSNVDEIVILYKGNDGFNICLLYPATRDHMMKTLYNIASGMDLEVGDRIKLTNKITPGRMDTKVEFVEFDMKPMVSCIKKFAQEDSEWGEILKGIRNKKISELL